MTRDEAVTLLLARCERREDDTYLQGILPTEMKLVQETVLERKPSLPWFLLSEEATANTLANEDRLEVPDDFLLQDDDQHLYVRPTGETHWKRLDKRSFVFLQEKFKNTTGVPQGYALSGVYFRFRPIPDTVYPVKFSYYARDTWPAGTETNRWLTEAADVLIAETGKVIAGQYLHNAQLADRFAGDAERAWQTLWLRHEQRNVLSRAIVMGGNVL